MKAIGTRLLILIMAAFMFTGCSKDQEMAYYLDGIWNGYVASM